MYVQSDTLLSADVFEKLRNRCIEMYELDLAKFFSPPGLVWQAALKKTKVKLDLLTDIVINGTQVEYVTVFINIKKPIINT